jgi:hypothetical protein
MKQVKFGGYSVWAKQVDADQGQHAHGDPKAPTKWRISWGGKHIGFVQSSSRKEVKSRLPSGVIVSYQKGFSRSWIAVRAYDHPGDTQRPGNDRKVTTIARTMTDACEKLLTDAIKHGVTP